MVPSHSSLARFRALRFVALLTLVAVIAAACGSSDPSDETSQDTDPVAAETPAPEPTVEADQDQDDTTEDDATADEPAADDAPDEDDDGPAADESSDDSSTAADEAVDATTLALAAETIDWTDCGDRLQCGAIQVPADYNDDSMGMIEIAVNVLRSPDLDERIGYLLINPGGPGQSGVDVVAEADLIGLPDELTNAFDLIGFDPRGVGASEPAFACGDGTEQFDLLNQIVDDVDTDEEIALGQQAAQLCIDSMGPVGARLHSEFVARDMDEIRKSLGADQISYLGLSYGSALGGWYASLFPDNVYSMVLDGAANPLDNADTLEEEIQLARETAGPLHEQLANALASCDSTACPIYNDGDPEGYWYGMADKFQLVSDAEGGNPAAIVFGIVGHLYTEATWPVLHQSIFDLGENDDPAGFIAAIDRAGTVSEASVTAHINCLDAWALFPDMTLDELLAERSEIGDAVEAAVAADYPLLDAVDLPEIPDACWFYETVELPVFTGTFDGGGIPILVIGNTSDPITPFIKSEQYANDVLADGRLVKVEHPQHVVYPANNCVNDYVHAALIDLEYPDDEPTCEPTAPAGILPAELIAVEFPDGSQTVRPANWVEIGPGAYAQATSDLDPVVLAFAPTDGDPEGTVAAIAAQAAFEPEVAGTIEINDVEWTLYRGEIEDLSVRLATSPGPDGVMILGQAFTVDIDQLEEQVLQPAVEAFTPAP